MASTFVSKSRRVRFELTLRIEDLNNVPLVSGSSFVKWHIPSSNAAEHRGRTNKCAIRDHRVQYQYEKQTAVRLTVGKDGMLQDCPIHFEVQQEYSSGGRGERIKLGDVHLNLAEYVDTALDVPASPVAGGGRDAAAAATAAAEHHDEGITRRYLMQESKINSTLKIGIHMRQTEGTRDYYAPALRTAPVFGGIAGIISSADPTAGGGSTPQDHPESTQESIPPSFNANNKEMGESQDMYRRTLAAFWTSQPGELRADDCIEDIFSGGDGWGKEGRPRVETESSSHQPGSADTTPNGNHHLHHHDGMSRDTTASGSRSGNNAERGAATHGHGHGHGHRRNFDGSRRLDKSLRKAPGELDEMDVREDLVSWNIGVK
ncbi:uncharacterized protein SEPMUDRAFT_146757 [Sphaerulina musiva SO2202]|uniref:C2 NT-type domain-containing protein n=1 Tax=Sphaerulina musiva (strain SO2202) TaxID=692275 RepID=N1QN09_SPHMS|nr:uncharacterized protein SEPMUDRAFT_146757 [Sphaerulina musiva SO2202]EMF17822.1 hypothetical protein SEPMUDRAFT_146757 [Sphaerulina musiva SO2202]